MLRTLSSTLASPLGLSAARPAAAAAVTGVWTGGATATRAASSEAIVGSVREHLNSLGVNLADIRHNLTYDEIFDAEVSNNEGRVSSNGVFMVDTGKFTGRSPKDKWVVKQSPSAEHIHWGKINQPTTIEAWNDLYAKVTDYYKDRDAYVFDGFCGASAASQRKVRFVTELAWQHHFVTNMFIRPDASDLGEDFAPDFTIINACKIVDEDWKKHGHNSEVFVLFNIEERLAIIGGTWYGGEMKKGIFSMMNYWLPMEGSLPMHCSANKGQDGDTALFFGLSGTGKTTLSADPKRLLIGDDEHGWDDHGIFNFEGGCYAKAIGLSHETEPEIFDAIKRNALLENVWADDDGVIDYNNVSKTENTRVSYPIEHIDNHDPTLSGGHPDNIIFLTCDAYGVLPPVSRLSPEQAMYHFLSGYTAKVAGTERGITEPVPNFSACFGAAFFPLHPTVYAKLLGERMRLHNTECFLVNTGWSGGPYGVGSRMKLKYTRKCIDAILDHSIRDSEFVVDPLFQFQIPTSIEGVPDDLLMVEPTWEDKEEYGKTRKKLARLFVENFKQFADGSTEDYTAFGPVLTS